MQVEAVVLHTWVHGVHYLRITGRACTADAANVTPHNNAGVLAWGTSAQRHHCPSLQRACGPDMQCMRFAEGTCLAGHKQMLSKPVAGKAHAAQAEAQVMPYVYTDREPAQHSMLQCQRKGRLPLKDCLCQRGALQ